MGVRGAGVSVGPRGAYVHVGAGGVRYSQRIGAATRQGRSRPAVPRPVPAPVMAPAVEHAPAIEFEDSTSDALLDQIRRKARAQPLMPLAIGIGVVGLIAYGCLWSAVNAEPARSIALVVGVLGLGSLPWVSWLDRRRCQLLIHYQLDPLGTRVQDALDRLFGEFAQARAIWTVQNEQLVGDLKSGGGLVAVGRRPVHLGTGTPSFLATNARVGVLKLDDAALSFFPDRVLLFRGRDVHGLRYADLMIESGTIDILEEGSVPHDAHVVGTTWRFARKDGGPDLRFNNNRQIPIARYGTLNLWSDAGLQLRLHLSAEGSAAAAARSLREVQDAVRRIEARPAGPERLEALPSLDHDPPPLLAPIRGAVRGLFAFLSFRWLTGLPEWSAPAVWGVLAALAPAALIVRFARGSLAGDLALGAALAVTAACVARLAIDHTRRVRERKALASAAAQARFRAAVALEIKRGPLDDLRLADLLAASNASRSDAHTVGEEILADLAARFLRDGVITPQEQAILDTLTRALEIDPGRAQSVLSRARAARDQAAVAPPPGGRATTDDEARMLERLKAWAQSPPGRGGRS